MDRSEDMLPSTDATLCCMIHNAHNHPSGVAEPSAADRAITHELRDALHLVGVRVLDHLVIGHGEPVSMAARGLL